jgi:hypothetical protein
VCSNFKIWVTKRKTRSYIKSDWISVTNDHRYVSFVVMIIWSFPHSWLINYHQVWNKSNTMGVSLVEQDLHFWSTWVHYFIHVLVAFFLLIMSNYTSSRCCCDVHYDCCINNNLLFYTPPFVLSVSCFINVICIYVFMHTGLQHDFYVRWCSCRLTVTQWVSLVEQEPIIVP